MSSLAKVYLDYREADRCMVAGQTVTFTALGREISRIYAASVQGSAKGILLGVEFSPRETIKVKVEVAKDQWEEQVFEVAENARIRRIWLSASLRDLVPGDAVELELKNNKVTEIYAEKVELRQKGGLWPLPCPIILPLPLWMKRDRRPPIKLLLMPASAGIGSDFRQ